MKRNIFLPFFVGLTIVAIAISLALPKPKTVSDENDRSFNGIEDSPVAETGSLPASPDTPLPVKGLEPITFRTIDTYYSSYSQKNDVTFRFNTESNIDRSSVHISCIPSVPFTFSYVGGNTIEIEGDFPFGQECEFTIAKGMRTTKGALLEDDIHVRTIMPNRHASLKFLTTGSYYPLKNADLEFPYSVVNLSKIKIELYRSFDNNLFFDFNSDDYGFYEKMNRMEKIGEQDIQLDLSLNQEVNKMLNLESLLPKTKREPGFYLLKMTPVEAMPNTKDWYTSTVFSPFMLTDYAVNLVSDQINYSGISLYTHRLSSGEPVKNADVVVYSKKNQIAATGKTDDNGLARLEYAPAWKREDDNIIAVKVMTDKEFTFCPIANGWISSYDKYTKPLNEPSAFVFMERGACRPGESFTVSSFIRAWEKNQYVPLKSAPVTLSVFNPQSQLIQRTVLKTDDYGFVSQQVEIPQNALTGSYRCEFGLEGKDWGSETIYVNNYAPDRLKIAVSHTEKEGALFTFNDNITFKATAQYYFGPDAQEINASFIPYVTRATFPNHWKGWDVGSEDKDNLFLNDIRRSFVRANSPFSYEMPSMQSLGCKATAPIKLNCIFTASEPGGRSVTGTDSAVVYPLKHYIGLKTKNEQSKLNVTMGLLGCDTNKKEALSAEKIVKVTFKSIDWDYVLERNEGTYKRVWKKKITDFPNSAFTVTIPKDAEADVWTFTKAVDLPSGHYLITAQQQDNQENGITETEVWHYAGETGKRSADPHTLTFKTDAESYRPGDTAKITFRNPNVAKAFYVYGAQMVDGQQTADIKQGENEITLKIPTSCESGSYFTQIIIIGKNGDEYTRSIGIAELKISQEAKHRLTLKLDAPETAKPNEKINLTLNATDASDKPVGGEAFIFAVDSGVLSLTDFKTPDIFNHFYGPSTTVFSMFEMYGDLYPQLKILPDGTVAGGASLGNRIVSLKKKETAKLIAPPTIVPQSGKITVPIQLPDHTGAMRIMAVMSNDTLVGSGEYELKMRNPITVALTAPGAVAAGDEFQITLRAFNNSAKASTGTITVKCDGIADSQKVITVDTLAPNSQRDYTFRTRAEENGTFAISADFVLGDEKSSANDFITVRPVFVPQTITKAYVVAPGAKTDITIPDGFKCEDAELSVASSPLVYLRGAMSWLNQYPYGCVEQTVSKAFPFLVLNDLQKLGLDLSAYRNRVPQAYSSILAMLRYNGAFSMWSSSSGNDFWPEGSIYATHFILAAKHAKLIAPEEKILNLMIQYQRSLANNMQYSRAVRAYAAYVISLAGNQGGVIPARNIIASSKNDFAAFLAGAALIQSGYASEGAPAIRSGLNGDLESGMGLDALDGFGTYAAKLGMELAILSDLGYSDADGKMQKMAGDLVLQLKKNDSGWGTTQANAWACYGLAAYAKHISAEVQSLSATIAYDNGKTETLSGEQQQVVPLSKSFTISNNGKAPVFVRFKRTGTPQEGDKDVEDLQMQQIHLSRSYLNKDGQPVTHVKSGDLVYVKLHAKVDCNIDHLVIADLIPGGFEIEDNRLATRDSLVPDAVKPKDWQFYGKSIQKGDDRLIVYVREVYKDEKDDIVYKLRAVTPGKYRIPQAEAEAMYQPEIKGVTPSAPDDASTFITIE